MDRRDSGMHTVGPELCVSMRVRRADAAPPAEAVARPLGRRSASCAIDTDSGTSADNQRRAGTNEQAWRSREKPVIALRASELDLMKAKRAECYHHVARWDMDRRQRAVLPAIR